MAKLELASFLEICWTCPSQDSLSSNTCPTNLKYFSLQSEPTWSISFPPICNSTFYWGFESAKIINFVFFTLSVSLFDLNHSWAFSSSELAFPFKISISEWDIWKVVSSANRRVRKSVAFGRSFMKIRNSRGPRTEPLGTPNVIFSCNTVYGYKLLFFWQVIFYQRFSISLTP